MTPGEITGELVVSEGLVVEGLSTSAILERHELRLVVRETGADVDLVGGQDVGAAAAAGHRRTVEEVGQPLGHVDGGHYIDVEEEDVVGGAALARHVTHVILRVDAPRFPFVAQRRPFFEQLAHHQSHALRAVELLVRWVHFFITFRAPFILKFIKIKIK